jgi:ketosteroid isomerase-like protein
MSKENVEIVRASWEAWKRGDMAALFEFYDPSIEWDVSHAQIPGMGAFHGHDGVREFFRAWRDFFAEYHAVPEEFIDAGESVLVRVKQAGRGKVSSVSVEMPAYWALYRLHDGRAVRVAIYRDEDDARIAAGLTT